MCACAARAPCVCVRCACVCVAGVCARVHLCVHFGITQMCPCACVWQRCVHAYVHLAESAQPGWQCHVDTIDVDFVLNLNGQASAIQTLHCLATTAFFDSHPLVCLIIAKAFYMHALRPFGPRPVLLHDVHSTKCRRLGRDSPLPHLILPQKA